ncbi:MAG: hypothetical protein K5931_10680, partial [Lachnospiraceae bacterium]|nr:hypothetical protein [Lachnospiraceae bacterium]
MRRKRWLRSLVAMVALIAMLTENTYSVFAVDAGAIVAEENTEGSDLDQSVENSGEEAAEETPDQVETQETESPESETGEAEVQTSDPEEAFVEEAGAEGNEAETVNSGEAQPTAEEAQAAVTQEEEASSQAEPKEKENTSVSEDIDGSGNDAGAIVASVEILEDGDFKKIEIKGYESVPLYINTDRMNDRDTFRLKLESEEESGILYDAALDEELHKDISNIYNIENLQKKTLTVSVEDLAEGMEVEYSVRKKDGYPQIDLISAEEPEAEKELNTTREFITGSGYDEIIINTNTEKLSDGNNYALNIETEADAYFHGEEIVDGKVSGLSNQESSLRIYNLNKKYFKINISSLEADSNVSASYEVDSLDAGSLIAVLSDGEKKKSENKKIEYKDSNSGVTVTATLATPDAVPDEAQLRVTPVTGDLSYAYLEAMDKADSSKEHTLENTLLYDIAFIMTDENGIEYEYQPKEGTVNINISFGDSQLEKIGASSTEEVKITHLPLEEKVKDSVDKTLDAEDVTVNDIKTEEIPTKAEGSELTFETDSLSVYGADAGSKDSADSVKTNGKDLNPMLSKVKVNGNEISGELELEAEDFRLSLYFMENGTNQYDKLMYYKLPQGLKFNVSEPTEAYIELSGNEEVTDENGNKSTVSLSGKKVPLSCYVDQASDGSYYLIVELDSTNENYKYVDAIGNMEFNVGINAAIDKESKEVKFGGSDVFEGEIKIVQKEEEEEEVDNSTMKAEKSGVLSSDRSKIDYTVKITSVGNNKNVEILDILSYGSNYVTLDSSSVKVSSSVSGKSYSVEYGNIQGELWHIGSGVTPNGDGTFTGGISMDDGEVVTVTYTCTVKELTEQDKLTNIGTGNYVQVKDKTQQEAYASSNIEIWKYDIPLEKEGVYDEAKQIIKYTITINGDRSMNIKGLQCKDHFSSHTNKDNAYFTGDGIYVSINDGQATLIPWAGIKSGSGAGYEPGLDNINDTKTFYYTPIPESSSLTGYDKVVITYDVRVNVDDIIASGSIGNKIRVGDSGSKEVESNLIGFEADSEKKLKVKKTAGEIKDGSVDWTITFTVPEDGYNTCVLKDTLPSNWVNNELCFDSVDIDKDITVSSDDGSPVYYRKSLETSDGGQKKRVFIRFY